MRSRIFRTLKDEEVCFDLLDIIGKKPYCIYQKTTANSRVWRYYYWVSQWLLKKHPTCRALEKSTNHLWCGISKMNLAFGVFGANLRPNHLFFFQLIYHPWDLNQRPTEKPTIRSLVLTPIKSGHDSRRINQDKSLWNILNLSQELSQASCQITAE